MLPLIPILLIGAVATAAVVSSSKSKKAAPPPGAAPPPPPAGAPPGPPPSPYVAPTQPPMQAPPGVDPNQQMPQQAPQFAPPPYPMPAYPAPMPYYPPAPAPMPQPMPMPSAPQCMSGWSPKIDSQATAMAVAIANGNGPVPWSPNGTHTTVINGSLWQMRMGPGPRRDVSTFRCSDAPGGYQAPSPAPMPQPGPFAPPPGANVPAAQPPCSIWRATVDSQATAMAVAISNGHGPVPWSANGIYNTTINGAPWQMRMGPGPQRNVSTWKCVG